jgi:hypothetical protein
MQVAVFFFMARKLLANFANSFDSSSGQNVGRMTGLCLTAEANTRARPSFPVQTAKLLASSATDAERFIQLLQCTKIESPRVSAAAARGYARQNCRALGPSSQQHKDFSGFAFSELLENIVTLAGVF